MAFLFYAALTIVMTWPLAAGLTHDIPGDFGDPLFTSWVLSWDATHLGRGWWSANIFAPHPLALAYSEHFLPQALQVLPIYAITKNPILCYNLLFLSTFVLSGLGMFLLGRELTGSVAAGLVAGLAFAFAPYRIANIPHLQVLSSAWMPFVLFGLHRYFATGRSAPLAGAAAAWLVQNLSCGYYLLFFTPIVVLYIAWELTRRAGCGATRRDADAHRPRDRASCSRPPCRSCCRTSSCAASDSARDRWPKRGASPPTSTRISPPIPTCACGDRSRRPGRSRKGCCFLD